MVQPGVTNIAENSGGVHCLKYGLTTNNVLAVEIAMMDRLAIEAAEAFVRVGYPLDVETLLIVELDGAEAECTHLTEEVLRIAGANGAVSARASADEAERIAFWAGRKAAFPAVGRLAPDYYCMDGTIPRGRLPLVLERMADLSRRHGLAVANVFHAGDGNLHPLILYDANRPGELDRAEEFGNDILRLCVEVGGLVWIGFDGNPAIVRATAARAGGNATLVRGDAEMRALTPTFHPPEPGVARLEERVRRAFDPHGVFKAGRF